MKYWHEYRTLAKVQALEHAYESLIRQINNGSDSNANDDVQLWESVNAPTFGVVLPNDDDNEAYRSNVVEGTTTLGKLALKRVLIALDRMLSGGTSCYYAPLIPAIVSLLLTAQSEAYAFCAMREMSHQPNWYFPVGKRENTAWCRAFSDVLHKLHPQTADYLEDRGVLDDLSPIFSSFFIGILPTEYCLRIMDIYTLEGAKVLFRFGVALLVLFKREAAEQLLTISNANEWWHYFCQWTKRSGFPFDMVVRKAYGVHGHTHGGKGRGGGMIRRPLRFPRRHILQRIIRMEEHRLEAQRLESGDYGDEHSDGNEDQVPTQPLGLVVPPSSAGGDASVRPLLAASRDARLHLAAWMPLSLQLTNLDLLYSTNYSGRSLVTFYNCVRYARHTVLLCEVLATEKHSSEDEKLNTFVVGMYASQAWRPQSQVYGDGACFLFRLQPSAQAWKWKPHPPEPSSHASRPLLESLDDDDFSSSNTTALLEQFMVSTDRFISMGGNPDGSSGLRFNEDFTKGESSPAVGFENEPLQGVGRGSVFEVGLVEVYGLTRQIDGKPI